MKTRRFNPGGFTLVDLMIVVAITGLIAAVALPHCVRARSLRWKNTCITNLRQIQNAKLYWAQEARKSGTDTPADADLFGPTNYLRCRPICPAGGQYALTQVQQPTECNLAVEQDHVLVSCAP